MGGAAGAKAAGTGRGNPRDQKLRVNYICEASRPVSSLEPL